MTTNRIERTQCQSAMGSINTITTAMMCVQAPGVINQAAICSGDSGGPLTDNSGSTVYRINSWVVIGSGTGCTSQCYCCTGYPQVGANVAEFYSWINGQLDEMRELYKNESIPV